MRRKEASADIGRSPRRPDPWRETVSEGVTSDLQLRVPPPPATYLPAPLPVVSFAVWGMKERGGRLGRRVKWGTNSNDVSSW